MAAEALVSISTGVINSVLEKLATLMGEQYTKHKSMQREVAFLKDELSSIDAVLKKLENMEDELDPQTREWKNQVMEMAFHIEDCIDDFMHESGEDSNRGGVGFVGKIAQYINALRTRHQFAKQIQQLKTLVKDVSERRKRIIKKLKMPQPTHTDKAQDLIDTIREHLREKKVLFHH
ncbi:hypothetical protein CFC21_105818 [Triticum aestivum]|uniref:Disease resistance N-terminal domain-containing protein n=2 Tax=Triticum aestivum TaxID=4565 RepID=A0A9R1MDK1_WHEAT|nr:hypothetical protein CFC21_105818 [Triticum aestivum]